MITLWKWYEDVADSIIRLILKYRNHVSILSVGEVYRERHSSPFLFSEVDNEEIFTEI